MKEANREIKMKPVVPLKKIVKPSPTDVIKNIKKLTTKAMIIDTLTELHTRKGVSVYAIKAYLKERHEVNTDKLNFLINKTLKSCVEDGTIVQLKGIGASGSFKLAPGKKTKPKKIKIVENSEEEVPEKKAKLSEEDTKKPPEKKQIPKTKQKAIDGKVQVKNMKKIDDTESTTKKNKKSTDEKKKKVKMAAGEEPAKKSKVNTTKAKEGVTPAKKRAVMMRRKSSGSLIKPPKMKPKRE